MNEQQAIDRLAALLDGEDVAGAPASLGALATLADTVRDHADLVAPSATFRAELRAEVVALAEAPPGLVERSRAAWAARTTQLRSSARVAVATMTASTMIGGAGVAAAAQESLPGDLLYGVKGLTEDARLLLANDAEAVARLHLQFARERLAELRASAGQLTADEVAGLLAEMDAHSEAGAETLLGERGGRDLGELRDFTSAQRGGLVALFNELPTLARPLAEDSLELLRRIELSAGDAADTCDCDDALDALLPGVGSATSSTSRRLGADTVVSPSDGPAVPLVGDCDCIELPGGDDAREPAPEDRTSDDDDGGDADSGTETSEGDTEQEEPFEPTGGLADPGADRDDEDPDGLDSSVEVQELPVGESVEGPAELGTEPADRIGRGVEELTTDGTTDPLG